MKSGITDMWREINDETVIGRIIKESYINPVVVFKNSYRCGISYGVLSRFQEEMSNAAVDGIAFYLLDVLAHRPLSSAISAEFNVRHESPQALVIENGDCSYHRSHWNISFSDIMNHIADQRAL